MHKSFDKPSSENLFTDVGKPECNIVNETLSQSGSSDVLTNVITELKYDDNIEPSASVKEASYFNILECGSNLLDQLDVTYQCALTASKTSSTVPPGHYELSPVREKYYDMRTFPKKSNSLKIFKIPYLKRIPKHEPTSSYFHLVVCLG